VRIVGTPTDVKELVEVVVIMQSIGGVCSVVDFVLANGVSPAQSIFRLLAADSRQLQMLLKNAPRFLLAAPIVLLGPHFASLNCGVGKKIAGQK